jgi:hypothetical protein
MGSLTGRLTQSVSWRMSHTTVIINIEEDDPIKNPIPRGIVALEQIFDRKYLHKKKGVINPGDYIEINIGTIKDPKMIKIGKRTSKKKKKKCVQEYRDVFAFTYDELKTYREDVIQHTIPLK